MRNEPRTWFRGKAVDHGVVEEAPEQNPIELCQTSQVSERYRLVIWYMGKDFVAMEKAERLVIGELSLTVNRYPAKCSPESAHVESNVVKLAHRATCKQF